MNTILIFVIILVISIFIFTMSKSYFNKKYGITYNSYRKLLKILQNIRNNKTHFMNIGLWSKKNNTLEKANLNLCRFILEKGDLKRSNNILDVGVGYGEQDFYWLNNTNAHISSIEIDKLQVKYVNNKIRRKNLQHRFKCIPGDATKIPFPNNKFDTLISLESAFHYNPRYKFFDEAKRVLKPGGKFIIADIVLKKNNIYSKLYVKSHSNYLSIPDKNLISVDEWRQQIKKRGFNVKLYDITQDTFKPYLTYFYKNYRHKNLLYKIIGISLLKFIINTHPYAYVVAICNL